MNRPLLVTERLRLEPLTVDHTEDLVDLDSDPEVLRHIFGHALTRDEVVGTWMPKRLRSDADARGIGYWVGRTEDGFAGWWCLAPDDEDPTAAELGYRLRRDSWGQGLASEGARALLHHAFHTVGLSHVWGETMAVNAGSRRVMERVGLRLERSYTQEWDHPLDGWEQGEVVYAIDRAAYLSLG